MNDSLNSGVQKCPGCNRPVDPLRSPAVSVIGGKIVHFCSAPCREKHLKRSPEFLKPKTETVDELFSDSHIEHDTPKEPTLIPPISPIEEIEPPPPQESSIRHAELVHGKLIRPLLLNLGAWLIFLVAAVAIPPAIFNGMLTLITAASGIIIISAANLFRERKRGFITAIETFALPFASLVVLSGALFSKPTRHAAVCALLLPTIEAIGRLLEFLLRQRSSILRALDPSDSAAVSLSWKDNSSLAEGAARLAKIIERLRFPLAVAAFILVYYTVSDIGRSLVAAAIAVVALNPRTVRMSSGDAHLQAAVRALSINTIIRDADAVHRVSQIETVLFTTRQTLFKPDFVVADWKTSDAANPQIVLDALYTIQVATAGRIASALSSFAAAKNARAASNCEITAHLHKGLSAQTPWGSIYCGNRMLLLSNGISTGLLEDYADEMENLGRRVVFMALDDVCAAAFALEEQAFDQSLETLQSISAMGLETALITQAEAVPAQAIASKLKIDSIFFETPDEQIPEVLRKYSDSGGRVMLVGNGKSFENHFRSAHAAIALNAENAVSQAGFNIEQGGIDNIPILLNLARRASQSATVNLIVGVGVTLLGLGLAVAGVSLQVALAVAAAQASAAAACTINGPFPVINSYFRRVYLMLFHKRKHWENKLRRKK